MNARPNVEFNWEAAEAWWSAYEHSQKLRRDGDRVAFALAGFAAGALIVAEAGRIVAAATYIGWRFPVELGAIAMLGWCGVKACRVLRSTR